MYKKKKKLTLEGGVETKLFEWSLIRVHEIAFFDNTNGQGC